MKNVRMAGIDNSALVRQLAQSEQLQQAQAPQGGMAGRFYVAPSVTERMAAILKNIKGDELQRDAEGKIAQAQAAQTARMASLLRSQMPQGQASMQPTTETPMGAPPAGPMPGQAQQGPMMSSSPAQAQAVTQPPQTQQQQPMEMPPQLSSFLEEALVSGDRQIIQMAMDKVEDWNQFSRKQSADAAKMAAEQAFTANRDRANQQFTTGRDREKQRFDSLQSGLDRKLRAQDIQARQAIASATQGQTAQMKEATLQKHKTDLITGARKEFADLPEVKDYKAIIPAQRSAHDAMQRNTPVADMNMIYAMAKIFDPTSVVREGEYASVQNTQSPEDRMRGLLSYITGGGTLTKRHREALMQEVNSRSQAAKQQYDSAQKAFEPVVQAYGIQPELVFMGMTPLATQDAPAQPVQGTQPPTMRDMSSPAPAQPPVLRFDAQGNPVQ